MEPICDWNLVVIVAAEEGNAMAVIADRPVEAENFIKHCEQRRKYPVLLRVEFQVNSSLFIIHDSLFIIHYSLFTMHFLYLLNI